MAATGTGLQRFSALGALDVPCIPFGSSDTTPLKLPVQFGWELSPDPTRGADHCLHLGRVCLKPHPLKQAYQQVQRT